MGVMRALGGLWAPRALRALRFLQALQALWAILRVPVCIFAAAGILIALGAARPAAALEAGVEMIQHEEQERGRVDFRIGVGLRPSGARERLAVGGAWVERLRTTQDFGVDAGLTYHLSGRAAVTGGMAWRRLLDEESVRAAGFEEVEQSARSSTSGSLGLQLRLDPRSTLDPRLGLSLSSGGRGRIDVSLSRIADPIVSTLALAYSVTGGDGAGAGGAPPGADMAVSAGVGFVANDRLSLTATLGHHFPVGRRDLPATSLTLRWNWAIDTGERREVTVLAALRHSGGTATVSFGVEFGGRAAARRK